MTEAHSPVPIPNNRLREPFLDKSAEAYAKSPSSPVALRQKGAYLLGMPNVLHWTLVFTPSSLEHLAERDITAEDVADTVFGYYGPPFVRKFGRDQRLRWLAITPLEGGEFLSCVLRLALPRDVTAKGAFVIPATGVPEAPSEFKASMRLCVSARLSATDEVRSYRAWRRQKGNA